MSLLIIPPFASGTLELDGTHTMYWEQLGDPQGQAVVLLHGGPGAGIDTVSIQLFDTRHYRVIAYDQRGAGRSTPSGCLEQNTTQHLVDDLEILRHHLDIDSWIVYGGSWGSSLCLAYAQTFPACVNGIILRGVFLSQSSEVEWFFDGIQHIFPETWCQLIDYLASEERDKPVDAYYRLVMDSDPGIHFPAARQWCSYESRCSTLLPNLDAIKIKDELCLNLAKIQLHYFKHRFFVDDTQLLDNIDRVRAIPAQIVHGRYDLICPLSSADQLHKAWPEATMKIVANAGHSISEPGIRRALQDASEHFKSLSK